MFNKLKDLFKKKEDNPDEYLDFSNYSDIEPERLPEDKTEITENNTEDKLSLKDRLDGFLDRGKSSNTEIEKFEEGSSKKKTFVRFILICLIAILIAIVIDDTLQEDIPSVPVLKKRFKSKKKKPFEKKTVPVTTTTLALGPEGEIENISTEELESIPESRPIIDADLSDELVINNKDDDFSVEDFEESETDKPTKTVKEERFAPTTTLIEPNFQQEEDNILETTSKTKPEPSVSTGPTNEEITKAELERVEKDLAEQGDDEEITNLADLNVNYLASGSGLVYNCAGKHWACISKLNYTKCKKLTTLNPKRCQVFKNYSNRIECQEQQIKKINANTKTDFCY